MKILGIVVELNPYHYGHRYLIEQARALYHPDIIVMVMSSSFTQRGECALSDKWTRSKIAIKEGVDIVIELPIVYSVESADYFASGALKLLNGIGCTDILFGSEEGYITLFEDIARISVNNPYYESLVHEAMQTGMRYPDACNKALKIITGKEIRLPNDLLGLAYVKDIYKNHYPMIPHTIKRTDNYHQTRLLTGSSIREHVHSNKQVQLLYQEMYKTYYDMNDYFDYFKYTILTSPLNDIHLVEEGLDDLMKKVIKECHSYDELVDKLTSKRYTRSRIQRMLVHVLLHNTKEEIQDAMSIDYIRFLGLSKNGQSYIKNYKSHAPMVLVSNYTKHQHTALTIEEKATNILRLVHPELIEEYKGIPYLM